jgi:hypothetical protein
MPNIHFFSIYSAQMFGVGPHRAKAKNFASGIDAEITV